MVQAHVAAKQVGLRRVVSCRLDMADFPPVLVYPTDRATYGCLCRRQVVRRHWDNRGFRRPAS